MKTGDRDPSSEPDEALRAEMTSLISLRARRPLARKSSPEVAWWTAAGLSCSSEVSEVRERVVATDGTIIRQ